MENLTKLDVFFYAASAAMGKFVMEIVIVVLFVALVVAGMCVHLAWTNRKNKKQ